MSSLTGSLILNLSCLCSLITLRRLSIGKFEKLSNEKLFKFQVTSHFSEAAVSTSGKDFF